jgi:O-antigen/teichoic acid export membrane protein
VRFHEAGRPRELARRLATTLRWTATLAVPVLLAVAVLRSDLLALASAEYAGRAAFFMLLLPIPYLECSLGLAGNAVIVTGHSPPDLTNNVVSGTINFLLNLWLIPRFGLPGAAAASALAQGLKAVMEVTEMRWVVGVPLLPRLFYKPHLAGALAAGALLAVSLAYVAPASGSLGYRIAFGGRIACLRGAADALAGAAPAHARRSA